MEWRDQGILLAMRPHGEGNAVIEVLTAEHGRHAGLVRGGAGRSMAAFMQTGAVLQLEWRARLADHLGAFRVEPLRAAGAAAFGDRLALAALGSMAALAIAFLPEREAQPAIYAAALGFVTALASGGDWQRAYVLWEMALLRETGFGPDLSECAVTGARAGLAYVSPRTGRAVTLDAAGPWAERLLPLPAIFAGGAWRAEDFGAALRLTGFFLERWAAPAMALNGLPPARERLAGLLG